MRFSAIAETCPGAQPAYCIMGTGSFPRVTGEGEEDVNHPPVSSTEVKERVELYNSPLRVPSWQVVG